MWEQMRKTSPVQWAWLMLAAGFGFVLVGVVQENRESRAALVRIQADTQERIAERDAVQRSETARDRAFWDASNQRLTASLEALKAEMVRLQLSLDRVTRKLPGNDDMEATARQP